VYCNHYQIRIMSCEQRMSFFTIYPGGGTSGVNKLKSGKSGGPNRITTEYPKCGSWVWLFNH